MPWASCPCLGRAYPAPLSSCPFLSSTTLSHTPPHSSLTPKALFKHRPEMMAPISAQPSPCPADGGQARQRSPTNCMLARTALHVSSMPHIHLLPGPRLCHKPPGSLFCLCLDAGAPPSGSPGSCCLFTSLISASMPSTSSCAQGPERTPWSSGIRGSGLLFAGFLPLPSDPQCFYYKSHFLRYLPESLAGSWPSPTPVLAGSLLSTDTRNPKASAWPPRPRPLSAQ